MKARRHCRLARCWNIGASGGFYNAGAATFVNCTVSGNGSNVNLGSMIFSNCILGDKGFAWTTTSTATAANCDIVSGLGTGIVDNGFNTDLDPLLAPIGNYGGPTQTMALLPGSPCIGNGTPVTGIVADQRGVTMPQGSRYDIGAFESQGFILSINSGNNQTTPVNSTFAALQCWLQPTTRRSR